ncbi:nucleotidyltransferase family protein [Chitinophaga sancti]|uniref:nucleotidyltransferase family protein n=1 Tax=Chitinophaga sancti TaxID=1004 RepID=UPI002A749AE7|nr:nucleotidyltransferase family protein [Chitinophaga sancti]WPQ61825.1 nucleotidyltransferase family protein [Chitinophaga sancti]
MEIEAISRTYSPEMACVIFCCRVFIKTAAAEDLEQFVAYGDIDWNEVYRLAALHRVRPIVYRVLNNTNIPEPTLTRFRNYCRALSVFAFERQIESARIKQVLGQQGISVRMYKGLDFTKVVYGGDISLREFTDMDMMIAPGQLSAMVNVMKAEGYVCSQVEYLRRFPTNFVTNKKDICFYKRSPMGRLFGFEFHYRPTNFMMDQSPGFDELLGKDSSPFTHEQYYRLMVLNHGASDYYPNLRSLVDIVMLSQGRVVDVPPKLRRYERLGQELASRLLNSPAPAVPADKPLLKCATLITEWQLTATPRSGWEKMYMHIRFSSSFLHTLRLMLRAMHYFALPNEKDINNVQLPLFKLYYLAKPVRLLNIPSRLKKVFS